MKQILITLILALCASTLVAQDQQLGARTKGMGGSYTAFEDDPISVWLNPGGTATQPDQMAFSYQTYTAYSLEFDLSGSTSIEAESILVEPALLPGFVGFTFQVGTEDSPAAVGVAYARPYHLKYSLIEIGGGPQAFLEQSMARLRTTFAKDFLFHDAGEPGWFTHLALGIALDFANTDWEFTELIEVPNPPPPGNTETVTLVLSDNSTDIAGGFGFLLGLYDNLDNFKVNIGAAIQSKVSFPFDIDRTVFPAFDMPQQINAGLTFFLFEGTPLRITVDAQWIKWKETAEEPVFAGLKEFEDVVNLSTGFEYRLPVAETTFLYIRGGYRLYDAPWDDERLLPVTGRFRLDIDTDDEKFNIGTAGFGFSWVTEAGGVNSLDFALDFGGDSWNIAISFTHGL